MTEQLYTVTKTMQSPGNEPVTIKWGRNLTAVSAAATVASILAEAAEPFTGPASIEPTVLSVQIELQEGLTGPEVARRTAALSGPSDPPAGYFDRQEA